MRPNEKYRGWDMEKKIMRPVGRILFGDDGEALTVSFFLAPVENTPMLVDGESGRLMKRTPFKDKNGKDIYFDDIVRFSFTDKEDTSANEKNVIADVVEGMNGGVALLRDGFFSDYWDDETMWEIEVLGNIYETPELKQPN